VRRDGQGGRGGVPAGAGPAAARAADDPRVEQDELARAAGVTRNQVSAFERAAQSVDVVALLRLSAALSVPVDELLDVGSPVADRIEGLPS